MMSPSHLTRRRRAERITTALALVLLLGLMALVAGPAKAQDYYFAVPNLDLQVYVQPDGSARLVYDITFLNTPSGRPIDVVDIGMPTGDYSIGNMSADLDGVPLQDIRPSEFVTPGVEVHLDDQEIQPGEQGTLHVEATIPNLVFQDVTNRDLASFRITPTWYGSEFLEGSTDVRIAVHLPEGISPDEVLYQNTPFTQKALFEDRAVAIWEFPGVRLTGERLVGLSFPLAVMTGVQRMSALELAAMWFEQQTTLRTILAIAGAGLFSIFFFRATGGTGGCLWVLLMGGLGFLFLNFPLSVLPALIVGIPLLIVGERRLKTRKRDYLPAIAQVEGGGIKRGLTAPEAAALLELPLNKVLTLIIFGLLKKGVLVQTKADPLQVDVAEPYEAMGKGSKVAERANLRQAAAGAQGIVLQDYDQRFLDVLEQAQKKPVKDVDFKEPMEWFLQNLARRMKGFDLSDTREYYQAIVKKAVEQAKAMGEIPEREKALDRDMEWILLDEGYPEVFGTPTWTYQPVWVRPIYTGGGGSTGGGLSIPSARPSSSGSPSLGDVTAGFAGWTENTMSSLAGSILPGSLASAGKGGFVDLSGFDRTVGSVFEAMGKSSGSGRSGGGGGCACACAGCACACACAGGGR